ncbi:MAG: PQQ-dependent sugar dehydrogenase, partial [Pseudomonadota bacterium]
TWTLNAPQGFKISMIAKNLQKPRWLALTPDGDLLVTETYENRILRFHDNDGDGVPEMKEVFATEKNGLNMPFGMAFTKDAFYLGNNDALVKFPYTKGQKEISGEGQRLMEFPTSHHWTRDVAIPKSEDWIYVSIGSGSNVSAEDPPRASVMRIKPEGGKAEIYAFGLRNPVDISFHPQTGELYTSVNERDGLGDDLVPDYITRVGQGGFYGWPYAYLKPENIEPRQVDWNGKSKRPDLVAKTVSPDVPVEAHAAVMQMAFPKGTMFPERYRNGIFVAMRGSWNSSVAHGYKIAFVPFKDGKPTGGYEDFITGFVMDAAKPAVWGRPVGAIFLEDGSLVFTDEENGRLYRVTYAQ